MLLHLKRWFAPPVFPNDEIRTRRASLVNLGLLFALAQTLIVLTGILIGGKTPAIVTVTVIALFVVCLVLYYWLRQGRVELAGTGILVCGGIGITVINVGLGTAQTPTAAYYVGVVIGAGLLFDLPGIIVSTALSSLTVLGLILAENAGRLPPHSYIGTITHWVVYTSLFGLMGLLTYIALRAERQALRRADREIDERKRAEEALRWSEALYHSLVETLPLSIFRKDADGRFTFANTVYCHAQGRPLNDILGKTDYDLHPRELADKNRADDQRVMATREVLRTIEEHRPLAGASTYVQVVKTPLYDAEEHVTGIQGAFWDVTDRVRVEETLREMNAALEQRVTERTHDLLEANVRLTELDQLKDEFIGRISHELRTPLTNIKLYLELLKRGKLEKHDQYMETLHQQADRLHHLIDDLLDISHLNLDPIDVRHELLDVKVLVHDVMTEHASVARERQLTLTFRPSSDLPRLATDRALLRQVFAHLLTNALSYTLPGGVITLHAALDAADRTWATIEVRDTGPGISANDLPHIFEPFYRGEAAADYRTPGAGVGLAIAQRIIGQLGGHITVDSQPGQGATFTVWLKTAQT
jgi:PAS domain S-box-containing protein